MKDGRDETFGADAVDEYDQAPDHEEAIVESEKAKTRTLCGGCDGSCQGGGQLDKVGWNTCSRSWFVKLGFFRCVGDTAVLLEKWT